MQRSCFKRLALLTLAVLLLFLQACPPKKEPGPQEGEKTGEAPARVSGSLFFADPALEGLVRKILARPQGELSSSELSRIKTLEARQKEITSLSGVEYLQGLQALDLGNNYLRDLSPLAGLVNLRELRLDHNYIVDLAPLAGLTRLRLLDLSYNQINDLGPLQGLVDLETLEAEGNYITDISPLAGLLRLHRLNLEKNQLTSLEPLVRNSRAGGMGPGDVLMISDNPLSTLSRTSELPLLRSRGLQIHW